MSTSGVGKLTCLTNTIINWGIPSFHLLPTHENTHIWSPVFVYYYKYTSYAVPRNKMFLDTPKKSLALIITSCDVKYNQIKHVQVGLTDEINNVVINRCDGVWVEQTGGIRYIKVGDIVNEETLRPVLNQRTSNEIHLRFFCIALSNQQHQKVNASILRDEEHEEVGEVRYSAPNVINWIIPSFSLLSRKKDTRLWSPSFSPRDDDGNSGRVPWVPPGFQGLILRSKDGKETPVQSVRFGIADMENSDICCCDGEWRKGFFIRHFRVSKFVSVEILNANWIFANDQFRLFCEVVNSQRCHVVNASTQTENAYGISISAATASSVSSTAAANIKENWRCRLCTLINPVDASNCEACNLPKSIKDKNLGSSEKRISPIGNPAIAATNLPLCIICISKERDIAFQPCGHLITCSDCADFRMKYCPLCRKDIQNKLKTFIN